MALWASIAWTALALAGTGTPVPIYLVLDGLYYTVLPGGTVQYTGGAWFVTATTMTACHRRDNDFQQYSTFDLFYGPALDVVYLNSANGSSYDCHGIAPHAYCAVTMTSMTDDILCSGTVAAPDPIFANGFEP